jgi:multiple sugar transport system substrate-binding protein
MARAQSESEYLARLVPPSVQATGVGRRSFLRGAAGLGAAAGLPALLAACGGDESAGSSSGAAGGDAASKTVSIGSNEAKGSGVPYDQRQAILDAFQASSGITVKVNAVDHNTFQEQINQYLQGKPDDVFSWFAGYRVRFFATQGLVGDVSDVWPLPGVSEAYKVASTGDDGKQYFVPQSNYPWAVFYRKSVWDKYGYTVPKTLDELVALSKKMQSDKLVPIAFADKDGWPAMGTFDILNMRVNGYDFHVNLMAGKESWTDPKVKKVFDAWKGLLPYHQADSLGRTWQEAAKALQGGTAGMYLLGLFVNEQFTEAEQDDLEFFNFPEIDSTIGAGAIDAPIDGFCLSADPANEANAKTLLKFMASKECAAPLAKLGRPLLLTNSEADTSAYTNLQKKAAAFIGEAKQIAQFLDRDTRPDFATTVMIPSLQEFIKAPDDVDGLLKKIEDQKKSIFAG